MVPDHTYGARVKLQALLQHLTRINSIDPHNNSILQLRKLKPKGLSNSLKVNLLMHRGAAWPQNPLF